MRTVYWWKTCVAPSAMVGVTTCSRCWLKNAALRRRCWFQPSTLRSCSRPIAAWMSVMRLFSPTSSLWCSARALGCAAERRGGQWSAWRRPPCRPQPRSCSWWGRARTSRTCRTCPPAARASWRRVPERRLRSGEAMSSGERANASMSGRVAVRWTGRIATVRGPMRLATRRDRAEEVTGSMSANTGAWRRQRHCVGGGREDVNDGTITSSPLPMPAAGGPGAARWCRSDGDARALKPERLGELALEGGPRRPLCQHAGAPETA